MSKTVSSYIVEFLREKRSIGGELKAIEHITDGIAVMLAGSRTDAVKKLVDFARSYEKRLRSSDVRAASHLVPQAI